MAKFSDRVFGNNVDPDVIKIFKNLQLGSFEQKPAESITPHKDYLGDRTPFARMWTASLISGSIVDEEGKPTDKTELKVVYNIVNDNRGKSYEPNDPISDNVFNELTGDKFTGNRFRKPKAGIKSITTKNEGSLGVIKNTTVEFEVHNKKDFEEIFLPFFMKPGATVIVDYGWSDSSIEPYDIKTQIDDSDLELSKFKKYIYGYTEDPPVGKITYQDITGKYFYKDKKNEEIELQYKNGFLDNHAGLIDTIVGIVKDYSVTVTPLGSFECTIELVSQNTTLLDQEITAENKLKFIFANQIEDIIVKILTGADASVIAKLKTMNTYSAIEKREVMSNFFENYLMISSDATSTATTSNIGVIPDKALKLGFFFQNMTDITSDQNPNKRDLLYISFGLFEDLFLNNLIAKLPDGDKKTKLSTVFNFNNVFIRFSNHLYNRQIAEIKGQEALPVFLYPYDWSNTYVAEDEIIEKSVKNETLYFRVGVIQGFDPDKNNHFLYNDGKIHWTLKAGYIGTTTIFTIKPFDAVYNEKLTIQKIINLLSDAKNNPIGSFAVYSGRNLKEAKVPTVDEIITSNDEDLARLGAHKDTILTDGMYRVEFKVPLKVVSRTSERVIDDKSFMNVMSTPIIPLQDVFISVHEIARAFSSKQNVNEALGYLLDRINKDSYGVLKLKLYSPNVSHSAISIQDANLMPPQPSEKGKMLIFDVTSNSSIVSDFSYTFKTPEGGLASMLAIGDKTDRKLFDEQTKDTLNFMKVLEINKFTKDTDNVYYKSLPLNTRKEIKKEHTKIGFDFGSVKAKQIVAQSDKLVVSNLPSTGPNEAGQTAINFKAAVDQMIAAKELREKNKKGGSTRGNQIKLEGQDRENFLIANSDRDMAGKKARLNLIYAGQDGSVSPILPIELSLTVYGNTYLNNGDVFNINFLPNSYQKRVFFQVIGVDQKLDTTGWKTTYNTIMRVQPSGKIGVFDEDRSLSFDNKHIDSKFNEWDAPYKYNLLSVIKHSDDLPTLPRSYKGYILVANYSEGDVIKAFDNETGQPSRILRNEFKKVSTVEDFLFIYAMTQTMGEYLKSPEKLFGDVSSTTTGLRIHVPNYDTILNDDAAKIIENTNIDKFRIQISIATHSLPNGSEDPTSTMTPQAKLLNTDNNSREYGDRITGGAIIAAGQSKLSLANSKLKVFFDTFKLGDVPPGNKFFKVDGVSNSIMNYQQTDETIAYKAVIKGFSFKLGEYGDVDDKEFYLIQIDKPNLKTMNSLRIPKWFLGTNGIKDFLDTLNKNYGTLMKDTYNIVSNFMNSKIAMGTSTQQAQGRIKK